MEFWTSIWSIVTVFFWAFGFVTAFYLLVSIITDLVRDKELNGWGKALWVLLLIFIPLVSGLVYLITRGRSMADRTLQSAKRAQAQVEDYIRTVAVSNPADEIAKAMSLLDTGPITSEEYERIKRNALT